MQWLLEVDRTVNCQLLSADVWVESRSITNGIHSGNTCIWTVLFWTILAFFCHRHFRSASSPYFFDLPRKMYKISNFQHYEIHHFFLYPLHILWFSHDCLSVVIRVQLCKPEFILKYSVQKVPDFCWLSYVVEWRQSVMKWIQGQYF
jgi:hypothetical protein